MSSHLREAAAAAREVAYAPYSGYMVGAAVLGSNGLVYAGCNVENPSYGLSICAERSSVFRMVSDGCNEATACAIATANGAPPCGACLQVLSEFASDSPQFKILMVDEVGRVDEKTLANLFPGGFRLRASS
ncbi:MAG: cytidine deaminase [Armatimonadetes bacterium]|nr:cytidine deaminase [Armatimonadota bacterium]